MKNGRGFALSFRESRVTLGAVNRVSKVILIAVGSLSLLAVGTVVAINLYVQSPATQARIEEEISRALRIPMEITNASLTPWGGLKVTGITVPGEAANFLEASSFSARYNALPLLKGKLEITAMVLDSPKILWEQNEEGRWLMPALPDTGEKKRAKDAAEDEGQEVPKKKEGGFKVEVKGFEIRNGIIEFRDNEGARVAAATNVHMSYSFPDVERVQGVIEIGHLLWKESLQFHAISSPFNYHKGKLELEDLAGTLGGGTVRGKLEVEPEKKDSPFEVALRLGSVDLAQATADAGWPEGQAGGRLGGEITLSGSTRKMEKAKGRGYLTLENGQFRQFEFFQTLGQVLQIAELANFRLRDGRVDFHVADEKTYIDKLVLEAPELRLSASGQAKFDGKLGLDAELAISERLTKQLPSFVKENLKEPETDGSRAIPFRITGRTDKPKTDLLDRLVGQRIGSQFDDLVSNIFGLKKKDAPKDKDKEKEKKKKKKDEAKAEEEAVEDGAPPVSGTETPVLEETGN
jgi:uncharacterized protein involved in outer membrane biogenesis